MRVPRLRVVHADHPVLGDAVRDPPPRPGPGVLDQFDVLTGDQGEQPDCIRGRTPEQLPRFV